MNYLSNGANELLQRWGMTPSKREEPTMTAPITPETDAYGRDPSTGNAGPVFDLPGADDDPRGERGQAQALVNDALDALGDGPDMSALPANLQAHAKNAATAVRNIARTTVGTVARLDALAADDVIHPTGRDRMIREAREQAVSDLSEHRKAADLAVTLLAAGLTAAAQPAWPDGADRAEAREELRLLLDAEPSADAAAGKLRDLAAGSDARLAALAVSPYARTYLRSRGDDGTLGDTMSTFAAEAALHSTDATRKAAGLALTKLDRLTKARMQAETAASFTIGFNS